MNPEKNMANEEDWGRERTDNFSQSIDVGAPFPLEKDVSHEKDILEPPEPVDTEKLEEETRAKVERDRRKEETPESESVLDEGSKKGETTDGSPEETKIEKLNKDKDAQMAEIRKEVEEELRKNPVRLTKEEFSDISQKVFDEQVEAILYGLSDFDKGMEAYPNSAAVSEAREKMLQKMVDSKVVTEAEKQDVCSKEAFYELLRDEYDAGKIRLAGWQEKIKAAFWGIPIIQQIEFFRGTGKGKMLVMPRIDGQKEVVSLEDADMIIGRADMDFKLRTEGTRRQENLRVLAEKEEAERQKRTIEKLEADDHPVEQPKIAEDIKKKAEAELGEKWPQNEEQGIIDAEVKRRLIYEVEEYNRVRDYCKNKLFTAAVAEMNPQEKDLLERKGQFEIRGVFGIKGAATLTTEDVIGLLGEGYTLDQIRDVKSTFWGKKILPGEEKPITSKQFDYLVDEGFGSKVREIITEDVKKGREKQKREWAEWRVKELEAEEKLRQEEERLAEKAKKEEAEFKAKIETAEKMPNEEKLRLLNVLGYEWEGANKRNKKIKAIEKVLEGKKYKCTSEDGKKLEGKEAKQEMERFKKELEQKNGELSDKIINTAEQLSGRKLRKEAREAAGYEPDKKNPDREKQEQFRTWLTEEVQKIFKDQVGKLEESSGMKIKTMRWLDKLMAGLPNIEARKKTSAKQKGTIDTEEPSPAEKPHIKKGKKLKLVIKNRKK